MNAVVLVGLGGCVGTLIRFAIARVDRTIPWGIITANIAASGLAGALNNLDDNWRWLIKIGVLGALSTWSTLAVAAVDLARREGPGVAAAVLFGTASASIASAWALLQL
ncbi:MAG: FluC/FEX family fluoride channel [Acidimicrobiales bacterium]